MIKKLSNFIVNKRNGILAAMLVMAVASIIGSQFVEINEDMTKYLPDDSNMKAGLDIMETEFPEIETSNTIRVMFDDLADTQKQTVLEELGAITYVDSVDYDAESQDYNKDNHTLFILNMSCDYGSDEEAAIESALKSQFTEYTMVWKDDDTGFPPIPMALIVTALAILLTVLFIMCGSWIEPLLFLVVIGVAVVINGGTNLILGSVASITNSIAAILQLVLSMDYSIILMNRYRQEKELEPDSRQAMKNALASSFSSVASSSFTTVIGLLMLIFMSFKIGENLGIVLAKGVFISMVCVLSMLPGIILACDKLIQKTAKKVLNIPTDWAAKFSHKMRYVMLGIFAFLFAGSFILQQRTGISYTLADEDEIADIFPKSNTVVMVYENRDEDKMKYLISDLEKDENVKSILGYGTILGKPYTSDELVDALGDISEDISLNSGVIDMLYYDYYNKGKTGTMTASEFLSFISNTVINDETFSEYIDDAMKEKVDMLDKFSDAGALTKPMNAAELADFFDMDAQNIKDLFLLYYMEQDGVSTGRMTLATFADFVINEVAKDPNYGSMFDESALSKMEQLATFTNAKEMTTPYTYNEIAALLDMDADTTKLLFIYYYAMLDDYDPGTMTLAALVDFLQNNIAKDPVFSSFLDGDTLAQIDTLALFTDRAELQKQHRASELSSMLGIDESLVNTIFVLHNAQDVSNKTMTLAQLTGFLNSNLLSDPMFGSSFDEATKAQLQTMDKLIQLAASNQGLTTAQMAQTLGMDEASLSQLYFLYYSNNEEFQQEVAAMTMTLSDFLTLLKANSTEEQQAKLSQMEQLITVATSGQEFTTAQMAQTLGMDEAILSQLYFLYYSSNEEFQQEVAAMTMTLSDFLTLLKANSTPEQQAQLAQMEQLITIATSDQELDEATIAGITGMNAEAVSAIFNAQDPAVEAMTLPAFLNAALQLSPDNTQLLQLNQIAQTAVSGTGLDTQALAQVFGIQEAQVQQLFGLTLAPQKTISLSDFTSFLVSDVLSNEAYANNFTEEQKTQLATMNQMVQLAASGTAFDSVALAQVFGIQEAQVQQLFGLTLAPQKTISLSDFTAFLVNDVLSNEAYANNFTEEQKTQLATMNQMVQLAASGTAFDSAALAQVFGIQETQVQQLFGLTLAPQKTISLSDFTAFLVNDVLSNEAYANNFTEEQKTQLATMNQMVQLAASGTGLDAQTLAKTFGMEKDLIEIVFRLYFGSDISCKTMSLEETVDFILTDSVMKNYLDSARISQLQMMQKMIKATINCTEFTYHELADLLGMDDSMLKMLYTVRASESQIKNWRLSMHTIINFLMDNSDMLGSMMGSDEVGSLSTAQAIINGSVNGTSYTADQISELMGMSKKQAQQLYLLYISKHGDTSGWTLSVKGFIDFIIDEVLSDSEYADRIDADTSDMLSSARTMVNAVISGDTYTAEEMGDLLSGLTDELESSMVELVYLYAESPENADPEWTMTLETLLSYMTDSVLNDSRFASVIDNDMRQKLFDAQDSLDEGRKQLVSQNYSRLIITSSYPDEGAETTAFFDNLEQFGNDKMEGEYYFVGNSAMNYEMQKTFDNELLFITLLTALAIFLIVAITFKSLSIPLILVLLVQCGVYITISITGALNGSIYYLALLVVECILMGSTVDYGILLTNYYCEARKTMDVKDALKKAYSGSIHTIMTSGLILILVTAAVGGMFNNPTVNAIIKTISMGALCATILILFVLPGVLAACDKIVTKKRNRF